MESKKYTLLVQGQRIPVSEEIYRVYYRERERERYLDKKASQRELSRQALEDRGVSVDYRTGSAPSAETVYFNKGENTLLHQALEQLPRERREQLIALLLGETTERDLAEKLHLSRSAIHRRKKRDMARVRDFILANSTPEEIE